MSFADFRASSLVALIHGIPRFGNSNSIALVASSSTAVEYKDGVIAFSIFLITLSICWMMVLLVLKIFYGQGRVGCAAGGDVVEVRQLKKVENLTKKERKQRILRNWRVQTTCLLACISMLPISVVMLQLGLNPFIASLDDIREINDEVDSRAFRGIEIITQLQDTIGNLQSLPTSGLLKHTFTQEKLCPNQDIADALNSTIDLKTLLNLVTTTWKDNVTAGVSLADSIIQRYDLESVAGTLHKVTNTTASVAEGINSMYSNNWILKLLVVIMDLVVIFLIIGILFTKDNTDFPAYQRFTSLLLLPLFCLTLIATVAGTCFFVSMAMANADFCAGGDGVGSPVGTIRAALAENGYYNTSIPYQALDYYGSDCLAMDPFGFLADIESTVASIHVEIMDLYSFLNTKSLINIAEACGGGNIFSSTNYTLYSLGQNLAYFQGTLAAVAELSGCSSISPIFRRLLFGTPCTKSVDGLGCLYFTLLSISMLGFVILSTRAALFNPVIRGRRSKKREKEFSDYKQFMSKFYDTSNWDLEWVPHIEDTVESNIIPQLPISDSEDTRSTPDISLCASDETNDDAASADIVLAPTTVTSTEGSVFVNLAAPDDVKGDDDSYDSTYSSDDGEIQSTGSHSNISRLFLRRRNQYPDELLSSMSSSSLLGRIFMRGSARDGLGGIELYNHESDLGNDSQQDNDNDDDSAVGVILTPPHMRYPLNLRRLARSQGTQPRSVRISDFEDCPLTPSLGQPSSKQRNEQHVASIQMFTTLPRSSIL